MTKTATLALVLSVAAAFALAGCTSNPPATNTTTSTTTTTTTVTSTLPITTTTIPTVVTLPPVVGNLTPTITGVAVLTAPDRAAPNSKADVCFRVEGTGKLPHVAIHYDTVSHPNSTLFGDYKGGASYPGDNAAPDPAGYPLPGVFCTKVPVGNGTVYFRAHALNPTAAPGTLSAERAIWAAASPAAFDLVGDLPEIAAANSNVTACWQTNATVPHTAIHWDTVSHPNSTAFGDYKGGAAYPGNATSAAAAGYTNGTYCTNLKMPASGVLYFRAHELNPTTGLDALTQERSIVVGSAVSVVSVGARGADGTTLVCWRAEGSGTVPHTAVHFDTTSHPNSTAFGDYKGGAVYPGNATTAAASGYTLPGPFCANVKALTGTLYFRAHVLVPGARDELSAETSVKAT